MSISTNKNLVKNQEMKQTRKQSSTIKMHINIIYDKEILKNWMDKDAINIKLTFYDSHQK